MKQKDQLLIELIKSVKLDNPSPEFTDTIITFLEEESSLDEQMDVILGFDQKMDLLPSVPDNFSSKTMEVLEERLNQPVFEPLISKKIKTVLMVGFILVYTFLLLDEFFLNALYLSGESLFRIEWFEEVSRIPSIFWISFFSLVILLSLDLASKHTHRWFSK